MTDTDIDQVQVSSGNVFQDAGFPDADLRLAKAELARTIRKQLEIRDLSQTAAATILGVKQPDVSDLVRGRLARFSADRLQRFLMALDMDVRIQVTPRAPESVSGRLSVEVLNVNNPFAYSITTAILSVQASAPVWINVPFEGIDLSATWNNITNARYSLNYADPTGVLAPIQATRTYPTSPVPVWDYLAAPACVATPTRAKRARAA